MKKDKLFLDMERAVLFGVSANFIKGVLTGKTYEKDVGALKQIKELLPNALYLKLRWEVIIR